MNSVEKAEELARRSAEAMRADDNASRLITEAKERHRKA